MASAGSLQAQLDELRDAGFKHVVLDLRALTFMDSSGVRLILREDRRARSTGRRFSLIRGDPAVQRVLDICGLSETLDYGASQPVPVRARRSPSRQAGLDRPNLGIAFQCYLAELRQQGRTPRRASTTGRSRAQAQ